MGRWRLGRRRRRGREKGAFLGVAGRAGRVVAVACWEGFTKNLTGAWKCGINRGSVLGCRCLWAVDGVLVVTRAVAFLA